MTYFCTCSILDHILQISFSNLALVRCNLALVKWQVLLYKILLDEKNSKEDIFISKEIWKVWDRYHSLGQTLFSLSKFCCSGNGDNDFSDHIDIHMTRIHFSLLSKFTVMLKVTHLPVMHCHIMEVVKMQWRKLPCVQQFVTGVLRWCSLYNPVRTMFISTSSRSCSRGTLEIHLFPDSSCLLLLLLGIPNKEWAWRGRNTKLI